MREFISTYTGGHDMRLDDIGFIQQSYKELVDEIMSSDFLKAGIANPLNPFVLRGVVRTGNTFTKGSIFWNGEIYLVDDQSITGSGTLYWEKHVTYSPANVTYEDGQVRQVHEIRKLRPTYVNPGPVNGFAGAVLQRYVNPLPAFDTRLATLEGYNLQPRVSSLEGQVPGFARRAQANDFSALNRFSEKVIVNKGISVEDRVFVFELVGGAFTAFDYFSLFNYDFGTITVPYPFNTRDLSNLDVRFFELEGSLIMSGGMPVHPSPGWEYGFSDDAFTFPNSFLPKNLIKGIPSSITTVPTNNSNTSLGVAEMNSLGFRIDATYNGIVEYDTNDIANTSSYINAGALPSLFAGKLVQFLGRVKCVVKGADLDEYDLLKLKLLI